MYPGQNTPHHQAPQPNYYPNTEQNFFSQQQQPHIDLVQHFAPSVPYTANFTSDSGAFPCKSILIKGVVLPKSQKPTANKDERMVVELCCGQYGPGNDKLGDRALHINPRFDSSGQGFLGLGKADKDIVFNSSINSEWGPEHRCANSLKADQPFAIHIEVLPQYFRVSVNGQHVYDYIHRMPWERIRLLHISGCCRLEMVECQSSFGTPGSEGPGGGGGSLSMPSAPRM